MRVAGLVGDPPTAQSVTLPFDLVSVGVARRRVGRELRAAGLPEGVRADVLVVLSELLGNAVRHARPLDGDCVEVLWRLREDEVELAVVDGGAVTHPRAERPPFAALSGRGLGIVDALAGSWGVEGAGSRRQLVWAVVDLRVPPGEQREPRE